MHTLYQCPLHSPRPPYHKLNKRTGHMAPQVMALYSLRHFDPSEDSPMSSYKPSDPEIVDLLSRDPAKDDKHPFQAAMDDCLMITIKGIAAGMQNTG